LQLLVQYLKIFLTSHMLTSGPLVTSRRFGISEGSSNE
jgi:hypothetical protein